MIDADALTQPTDKDGRPVPRLSLGDCTVYGSKVRVAEEGVQVSERDDHAMRAAADAAYRHALSLYAERTACTVCGSEKHEVAACTWLRERNAFLEERLRVAEALATTAGSCQCRALTTDLITRLQAENTKLVERARVAESIGAPPWMKPALDKAISRAAFVDINHVYGVLVEEMAELLDEVRRNRGRRELIDIAAACMKAIKQVEDGEL